jgi:hypothetical protein
MILAIKTCSCILKTTDIIDQVSNSAERNCLGGAGTPFALLLILVVHDVDRQDLLIVGEDEPVAACGTVAPAIKPASLGGRKLAFQGHSQNNALVPSP